MSSAQPAGIQGSSFISHHSSFMIYYFGSIDSTQRRARAEAQAGRPMHGVVLWAGSQSAGHGRTGRAWSSEPGGLYVTACLPEGNIPTAHIGWLPLVAALACAEELESRFGLQPKIKWPNDVFIDDRKIAGVIGDAIGDCYLIGMGLNWANQVTAEIPTTSIEEYKGLIRPIPPITPIPENPQPRSTPQYEFLIAWLDRLGRSHEALVSGPEAAAEQIRINSEARLWRRGEPVRLERTEIGPVEGKLIGLGPGGSAIIEQNGETKEIYSGNVDVKS
jgi:BirA family transcriptional regulator, biotin operon repressor / biotin---[acetyl-CoA-carboxylase] ligase